MAWLRRILGAARNQPGVAVAAVLVLFGSAVASAAIVMVASDDDENSAPPSTTTTTEVPPTTVPTTIAPTTTTVPPTTTSSTTAAPTTTADLGQRCLVRLHGKGGRGADTYTEGGVKILTPDGNDEVPSWGGLQWLYFPNGKYNAARKSVGDALDDEDCDTVIINGFSNGAAFAGKLACNGETFDDRVIGYVIDDPVPDHGVKDCRPADDIDITLYWTGALDDPAQPGWNCRELDWTCEGGTTIGIDAYADALGTDVKPSKYTDHNCYQDAPELSNW